MIRTIKNALLLAGLGASACFAGTPQAEWQVNMAPEVYTFSSGGRSYLGVDIQDVTSERLSALKLKEERGVEVTMVDQDAPAGKAGVKEHDVILEFNGTPVESEEQLRRLIRETPPGRTVTLGISRDGTPMKLNVQLGDRGKNEVAPKVMIPPMQHFTMPRIDVPSYSFQIQTYSSMLGIQTENLSRQLGDFFGVKDGEGVLVRSVEKGSAAEKAGLKAGDVIVRADNEKLSDRADLAHILSKHRDGGKLTLGIMREKREQTLTIELPRRGSDDSFWRYFPSEEFESNWSELQEQLRDMVRDTVKPQIAYAREIASVQARSALEKARVQLRETRPEVKKAVRAAQEEARRARKLVEQELRDRMHDMI